MTLPELAKSKVEQLAADFRKRGYSVHVRPSTRELPSFLKQFEPDMIATSDAENVVVEVKSVPELESEHFVRLAEAVESQTGWRLQLAVVDLPAPQELPSRAELAETEQVSRFSQQAHLLLKEQRHEAAAMLAWSAVEAILRRHARARGLDIERKGTLHILKNLYVSGSLDERQYATLDRMLQFRNAFTHGFAAQIEPEAVRELIEEAENLQSLQAA